MCVCLESRRSPVPPRWLKPSGVRCWGRGLLGGILLLQVAWAETGLIQTSGGKKLSGDISAVAEGFRVKTAEATVEQVPLDQVVSLRIQRLEVAPVALLNGEERGWQARYFANPDFSGYETLRLDPAVQFDWGGKRVSGSNGGPFSASWQGYLVPLVSGVHQFALLSSGSASLWIDSRLVASVGFQTNSRREALGEISLVADKRYPAAIRFSQTAELASLRLDWAASSVPRTVVPAARVIAAPTLPASNLVARGVLATYYANTDFTHPRLTRVERSIDFNWKLAAPFSELQVGPRFSATYTGSLRVPKSGEYRVAIDSEGGVRVTLNRTILFEQWYDQPDQGLSIGTAPLSFEAGKSYDLKVEYFNEIGRSRLRVAFYRENAGDAPIFADGLTPAAPPDQSLPAQKEGEGDARPDPGVAGEGVVLMDGSFVAGQPTGAVGGVLNLAPGGRVERLTLAAVSRIQLASVPRDLLVKLENSGPGVCLHSGDFVEGEFRGMDAAQVRLGSILFGNLTVERERVLAVLLRPNSNKPSRWILSLTDGSRLRAETLTLLPDALRLSHPILKHLQLPLSALAELVREPAVSSPVP